MACSVILQGQGQQPWAAHEATASLLHHSSRLMGVCPALQAHVITWARVGSSAHVADIQHRMAPHLSRIS